MGEDLKGDVRRLANTFRYMLKGVKPIRKIATLLNDMTLGYHERPSID